MNGQDLLNFLLSVQQAGIDLNTLDIMVEYSTYDEYAGYSGGETYPSNVSINNNELVLGPTPYNG